MISAGFPSLLQSFFTDRLLRQRQASPHTIAGYRDCFRLLLQFAKKRLGKMPSQIRIEDLDAPFVSLFLDHLESTRRNSARTRNARLGAIHSFFRYVALEEPAHALHCQRILAVPNNVVLGTGAHVHCLGKGRKERCTLLRPETATMVGAWLRERRCGHGPPSSWCGSVRDRALAGARVRGDNSDVSSRGHAFERESAVAH